MWEVESGLVCGEESIFSSSSVCDLPAADEAVSLGMMTLLTVAAAPGDDAAGLMHTIRALLPAADPDDGCCCWGGVDGALLVVRDILVNGWLSALVVLPPASARTVCCGMSASRSNIPASWKNKKNLGVNAVSSRNLEKTIKSVRLKKLKPGMLKEISA